MLFLEIVRAWALCKGRRLTGILRKLPRPAHGTVAFRCGSSSRAERLCKLRYTGQRGFLVRAGSEQDSASTATARALDIFE